MDFAAFGLELLEAYDGSVELTLDGPHVAEEAFKAGNFVANEEIAVEPELIGLEAAGSGEAPAL